MNARYITKKHVARCARVPALMALLAVQSIACSGKAQPSEATGNQSAPLAVSASAVPPEQAVQVPRSVALQASKSIAVVHHDGIGAVPTALRGSAQ